VYRWYDGCEIIIFVLVAIAFVFALVAIAVVFVLVVFALVFFAFVSVMRLPFWQPCYHYFSCIS
jgi:hypothetical protein